MEEVTGYTEEEFEAMMRMRNAWGLYRLMIATKREKLPHELTPQERMALLNKYRPPKSGDIDE